MGEGHRRMIKQATHNSKLKTRAMVGVLLMVGPQGSGKGTQAALLSKFFGGIPVISPGALYRDAISRGTKIGKRVSSYYNRGIMVPEKYTTRLVRDKLSDKQCYQGVILDGYPRRMVQARVLDRMCPVARVIVLDISDNVGVRRLQKRRVCEKCGENYHLAQKPSRRGRLCEKCGGRLIRRSDDRPDLIRRRLAIYHRDTAKVIAWYRRRGLVVDINGDRPIKAVHRDILKKLGL